MIVGQETPFTIDNGTALQNVYRLNVGGQAISPSGDTGLFRSWEDDALYIFTAANGVPVAADPNMTISYPPSIPSYVAPLDVYKTARSMGPNSSVNVQYNLTWLFSVDTGFSYLVRLHFCEVEPTFTRINQRVFDIFLNNQTAEDEADVVAWAGHNGVPVYKDYVVLVPPGAPQQDMWLALHPNTASKSNYYDSILNGVEVFKISDSSGNLAGPNPVPAPKQDVIDPSLVLPSSRSGPSKNKNAVIGGGVGGSIALILLLQESAEESGKGIGGPDVEDDLFDVAIRGKKDQNASPGFDGNVTDSRSSGISMSIGGRSLASEDSDGLTPSAVFSQIMNPKGR
ncbi:hypothetical protein RJ639_005088 [Escallonia herrerae]|uniref:Malectin-like domain-containing protein n=1 Tax=Escallonia herrerae TaxID=1293975 RepID=A0AA88VZA4_9ASTE|nr:hypothetical protein RJ639_005088 [Escallonia herrerae]